MPWIKNYEAKWSPDGTHGLPITNGENIVCHGCRRRGQHCDLTTTGYNLFPDWSPDGEWIVFARGEFGLHETLGVHRMRPDGSELQRVTSGDGTEFFPTFTPDGASIIYARDAGGYYRMSLSDGETAMLDESFRHQVPMGLNDWSASGEWVAYRDDVGIYRGLARIRVDGSDQMLLTDETGDDSHPSWSPPMSLAWHGWVNALVGGVMLLAGLLIKKNSAANLRAGRLRVFVGCCGRWAS